MKQYTMQDMIENILKTAELNFKNREQGDIERTNNCAVAASQGEHFQISRDCIRRWDMAG